VTTITGSGKGGLVDGDLKSAQFNLPCRIFFDSIEQSLLVCDSHNFKLRKVLLCEGKINNLTISFLTILTGSVITICDVSMPISVVITESGTILVASFSGTISKVMKKRVC
jgi:hypothetical protein